MKKIGIFVALIFICGIIIYTISIKNVKFSVNYEYVGSFNIKSDTTERSYCLCSELESLHRIILSEVGYNIKNDSLIGLLDFKKYDYIASFKKRIISIEYDLKYANKYDHCEYIRELKPLKVDYSITDTSNKVFIYKILDKNTYRHLCP